MTAASDSHPSNDHGAMAIVGASPSSRMVQDIVANATAHDFPGPIVGVNPRRDEVLGLPCYPSLSDVPGHVSIALLLVGASTCVDVVLEASRLGVETVVVITAGFSEGGEAELEARLVSAVGPGTTMYGPNCIGFVDMPGGVCAVAQPVPPDPLAGPVSVISQSGGLLTALMASVVQEGVGIDWAVSIGNAATFDLADAVAHAVGRGTTSSLCIYAEEFVDDGRLTSALERARDAGVSIALLKPHSTSKGDRLSLSHTASLAEDDDFVDLFCARHDIARVANVEELARAAALGATSAAAAIRRASGVAVVGGAGGGSALAITASDLYGLPLAEFSRDTIEYLQSVTAPGSFVENPVDLVRPTATRDKTYGRIFGDPQVDFVLAILPITLPQGITEGSDLLHQESMAAVARLATESGVAAVISTVGTVADTPWVQQFRRDHPDIPVVRGLATTMAALARMAGPRRTLASTMPEMSPRRADGVIGEIAGRALIEETGIELARTVVCKPGDPVDQAYRAVGSERVVVKADVAGVSHKAKLGAVQVGIDSAEEAAAVVAQMYARLTNDRGVAPDDVQGFLVQELVSGHEVLIGLTRSGLGTFVTIGVGGGGADVSTSQTLMAPVGEEDLREVLHRVVGDLSEIERSAVAITTTRMVRAFESPAFGDYRRFEINPLIVDTDRAVAADVLLELETAPEGGASTPNERR